MSYLIDKRILYKQTAEWEAQALAMVEKTMHDEDPTEWRRWSAVLTERTAFKHDIADAPTVEAIPIEWMLKWNDAPLTDESKKIGSTVKSKENGRTVNWNIVKWMILEWRKEHDQTDKR